MAVTIQTVPSCPEDCHSWVWVLLGDGAEISVCQKCGTQFTEAKMGEICNLQKQVHLPEVKTKEKKDADGISADDRKRKARPDS